jgi:FixJ family two-component response regulator
MAPGAERREIERPRESCGGVARLSAAGGVSAWRPEAVIVQIAGSVPEAAIERATRPDIHLLFELAGRLEASVEGPTKQGLVKQLIITLVDLSRIIQDGGGGASTTEVPGFDSDHEAAGGKSTGWARLIADLTASARGSSPTIAVVDRDAGFRSAICQALEAEGLAVDLFSTCEQFLVAQTSASPACLIIDSNLPGMTELELLRALNDQGHALPVIVVADRSEVQTAVAALKAGVVDFLEKPIRYETLFISVERALLLGRESQRINIDHDAAADRLGQLTQRQRQVMDLILAGHPSKNIAADIGISQRTVESHRAEVMRRTGTKSMPALARLAAAAAVSTPTPLAFDLGPAPGRLNPNLDGVA